MEKSKREAILKKDNATNQLKKAEQSNKVKSKKSKPLKPVKPLKIGDRVRMKGSKEIGDVIQIDGKSAKVEFGILTAKVKVADLTLV